MTLCTPRNLLGALAAALLSFNPLLALAADSDMSAPTTTSAGSPTGESMQPGSHMRHPHDMMRELKKLNLSDQQWSKVKDIQAAFTAAHQGTTPPTRDEMRQMHKQILAVLTPDQRAALKADMKKHWMEHHHVDGDANQGAPDSAASSTP